MKKRERTQERKREREDTITLSSLCNFSAETKYLIGLFPFLILSVIGWSGKMAVTKEILWLD